MTTTVSEPMLYDVDAAARAVSVSPRLIRRIIADGELPTVRLGRLIRISAVDLHAYIEAHRSEVR